jgi:hypothetical protein
LAQPTDSQSQSAESSFTPDFSADRGNPLRFGSVRVYPRLGVRFGSDNNVTQVPDGQPKRDENFWLYSPEVFADYISGGQKYEFGYVGAFRRNESSTADDVDSNALRLAGDNILTTRNRLSWEVSFKEAQEEVGDNDLTTEANEPLKFRLTRFGGTYRYGAEGSAGRLELDVGNTKKRYLSDPGGITDASNFDTTNYGARFLARLLPKTFGFVEVQRQDTRYDYGTGGFVSQDSDQTAVNLGLTWRATAKTNAALRVGRVERDYTDASRQDFKGTNWDLSLNWNPLTYSQFSVTAARQVRDSISSASSTSDYILADVYSLRWNHAWLARVRSTVTFSHEKSDYENSTRQDKLDKLLVGVYYDFRSYLSFGLEYSPSSRDSTDNQYDFDRKQTMAVIQAKF